MQLTTLSNPYTATTHLKRKQRKVVKEEIELRGRPEYEISPWWKIITVSSYFVVVTGGIFASISTGLLLAAFRNNCIFFARLTVKGLDEIAAVGNITLYDDNISEEHYGSLYDCTFCEYCSVASIVFGAVWGIMFLQCGRGGITRRSKTESWRIVPPALLIDVIFFILSCVIFAKTVGGLTYFCNHLRAETYSGVESNITTCKEILAFHFPGDAYNTNLYLNFVLAQVGSFLTFLGWLVALFVLILRCFNHVDFVVYRRRLYEFKFKSVSCEEKRRLFSGSKTNVRVDDHVGNSTLSPSYELVDEDAHSSVMATTSFTSGLTMKNVSKKST